MAAALLACSTGCVFWGGDFDRLKGGKPDVV
jgi:hypothetical protein